MASVSLHQVSKRYGTVAAVRDLTLEIADCEFFVLLGPTGAGKSTTLRCIAGLEQPQSGEIRIAGERVNEWSAAQRDVALVFQQYSLYPNYTVRENLAFPLKSRLRNLAAPEIEERVAMGRAIVRDPRVFLYDEPLSNLDAKLRVAMRTELKELHQRLKTTSIYVTHDQIEAMTMGDQIVVMRDGRIEQTGSPLELYDRPANTFVAGFIGSPAMNFLPGTLRRAGGQASVQLADGTALPAPAGAAGDDGQPVIFGTRPEHLSLGSGGGIPTQVVVVEPTGADTFVSCRHQGSELSVVFRERHAFAPGSTIHLQPDLSRAHLFDAQSGRRLAA